MKTIYIVISALLFAPCISSANGGFSKTSIEMSGSVTDLSYEYTISPDNRWLIFLPVMRDQKIIAVDFLQSKKSAIDVADTLSPKESYQWSILWNNREDLYLYEDNGLPWGNYQLKMTSGAGAFRKCGKNTVSGTKYTHCYSQRSEMFSPSNGADERRLAEKHPEIKFKKTGDSLAVYYHNKSVFTHVSKQERNKLDPQVAKMLGQDETVSTYTPYYHSIAFSPDNRYAFYSIGWSGQGNKPYNLFLLDTVKSTIKLIDEDFTAYTPDTMIWTHDSKIFVYRNAYRSNSGKSDLWNFVIMKLAD